MLASAILVGLIATVTVDMVAGHAKMIEPPQRSSAFRYNYPVPPNYSDNQLNCGGAGNQWNAQNDGKCGVCGDPYNAALKENEDIGGKYVTGTITGSYVSGGDMTVKIDVTAYHRGWFEFRLCKMSGPDVMVTQACLNQTILPEKGTNVARIMLDNIKKGSTGSGIYTVVLKLPQITCSNCVLQWWWNCGNNWGCEDAGCGIGMGKQESFVNCADIEITGSNGQEIDAPSTRPPTTRAPITKAPTTRAPTTRAPITQAPTTRAPTTRAPTTRAPITQAPTTRAPITQAPKSGSGNECHCAATRLYAPIPGMKQWCCLNCAAGFCPPTHCYCWE